MYVLCCLFCVCFIACFLFGIFEKLICNIYFIFTDVRSHEAYKDSEGGGLGGDQKEHDKPNRLMSLEKQLNIENKV